MKRLIVAVMLLGGCRNVKPTFKADGYWLASRPLAILHEEFLICAGKSAGHVYGGTPEVEAFVLEDRNANFPAYDNWKDAKVYVETTNIRLGKCQDKQERK